MTVKNIADRSREIFMKYGIRSVSMDDISRELGMSKRTLYQHFLNKSDLVRQVLQFSHDDFIQRFTLALHKNQNAIDDLLEMSLIIHAHIREVNLAFTFDLKKYYPDLHREFLEKKRTFTHQYLTDNIQKGIRENLYRDDLNNELIAKLYVQKIEDLHDPQFFDQEQVSFGEVFRVMFDNHLRGIANVTGIRYYEERTKTLKLDAR